MYFKGAIVVSQLNRAWSAMSAVLRTFTFYDIKEIVSLAGLDPARIAHLVQKPGQSVSKGQLITEITNEWQNFLGEEKRRFVMIVLEEMISRDPATVDKLNDLLLRLGLQFVEGRVLPVSLLDTQDLAELDAQSWHDLAKGAARLRDGDWSGAISSASAAVDRVVSDLYDQYELGDVGSTSFQERCSRAFDAKDVFTKTKTELIKMGWGEAEANKFVQNLKGSLNHAAQVMQLLRANMSDVHGTRPVLPALAFDSLKWSQVIVRMLSD